MSRFIIVSAGTINGLKNSMRTNEKFIFYFNCESNFDKKLIYITDKRRIETNLKN